jgi:transposase
MRLVPIKSAPQQALQALHRIRIQFITWRTLLANEIRGLLGRIWNCGCQKHRAIAPRAATILEDREDKLSGFFCEVIGETAGR